MWRVVLASSLMLTLALGGLAEASPPPVVIESVAIHEESGGTTLRFTARFAEAFDPKYLPETGTAVVMQADGQRAKCINVSLVKTSVDGGIATYVGRFDFTYRNADVLSGRADIGGSIYDFGAPVDGQPGTLSKASYQGSITGQGAAPIVASQPVAITPDPVTIDPRTAAATAAAQAPRAGQGATAPTTPTLVDGIAANPMPLLGLIVVVVAVVSAYLDRKRSLARATGG